VSSLRRWAVLFAGAVLASACSGSSSGASGRFKPATPGTLMVAAAIPAPGFWEGTDAADVDGGFEYGLAHALADELDLDRVVVVAVPLVELLDGKLPPGADLALSQITITTQREKHVDFSGPYYMVNRGVIVRRGTNVPDLKTAKELTWGALTDGTNLAFLKDQVRPDEEPRGFPSLEAVIAAVEDGTVDAGLMDLPNALARTKGSATLTVPAQFASRDQYGAALPEHSKNVEAVSTAIRGFVADGTLEDLEDRWLVPAFGREPSAIPLIPIRSS
jgi:polar amino acid transport system substrate-binding protein